MTHARDALAAERRRMPWVALEKNYEFQGPAAPPYKWWNWHDAYEDTRSSEWSNVVDRGLVVQGQKGRDA